MTAALPTAPHDHDHDAPRGLAALDLDRRAKMEILLAIILALFLGALDQTIVGVALPTIVTELDGNALYTWVITIYLLTSTISGPFYGKLSDLYGRRPLLLIGISLFLVGSALSGLSQDIYQLILFRGIQGLGAGALFPIALAVVGDLFSPQERGRYQGVFGAIFGVASIVGPLVGGFVTESLSWHWIFYINIPIGLISILVISRLLPNVRHPEISHRLDYLGAAVFTASVSAFLIGLTNKQTGEWTDPQVGGLIALSVVGALLFLLVESRAAEPIVPLRLFRIRAYATSIAATFFAAFGFFALIIWMPLWFQFVKGATPTNAGLYALSLLAGLIIGSIASGQVVAKTGKYKALIVGSMVVTGAGLALMTNLHADTPLPTVWFWMFVGGLGVGPSLAVFTIVVQNAVPPRDLGAATSNLTFFRQVGGSIALAVTGTVLNGSIVAALPGELTEAGVPAQFVEQFAESAGSVEVQGEVGVDLGAQILASAPDSIRALIEPIIGNIVAAIHEAFSLGVASTFWWGLGATIIAFGFAILIPELPLRSRPGRGGATGNAEEAPFAEPAL